MQKVFTEERSHIFVKEPEGSWETILKYVNCTYGRIFVPMRQKKIISWFTHVQLLVGSNLLKGKGTELSCLFCFILPLSLSSITNLQDFWWNKKILSTVCFVWYHGENDNNTEQTESNTLPYRSTIKGPFVLKQY